jgi:catechol 2,3-dioxygenase-like lactoylglutathione lyase family enzyme
MQRTLARWLTCLAVVSAIFLPSHAAFAQLAPLNQSGVTLGHVHLLVPDIEAHKKLWIDVLGAQVAYTGKLEFLKIPGMIILLIKGQPSQTAGDPTVDHFALAVRNLAEFKNKLAAANIQMDGKNIALFPDGVRIEFLEDKKLGVPLAFHHFHIFAGDIESIRAWYTKVFGSVKFPPAANFPGGEIYFTAQPGRVPTKGHAIDHISFEVKGLKEFCKKLETQGVKLDMAIVEAPQVGLTVTFITDPIGTRIELTEGFLDK